MTAARSHERHVTVNGVRLRYLDWGTAGKTPLICLHGHTDHAHIWDEFAEEMSAHYRVLALDQRGHGGSQWADTGYARDRFVEDLAAFADALDLQRFVLVGLSMGGWHSLLCTMDHADRVERIVIVDIGPEPSPETLAEEETLPPTPFEFPNLGAAAEWMRERNPWAADARLRKDTEDRVRLREDGKWSWKADPALFNIQLPDMTSQDLIGRYWRAMETITCPILEVRGGASTEVTEDVLRRMASVSKQFRSVDVAGAAHIVPVDRPQEFVEATRSFLGVPG